MVDVLSEIVIDRPLAIVADFASNPDNAPEWYVNIDSAKWITDKPLQVGSQIIFQAKFLGKTLVYTYEITLLVPREKLVMKTAEGPFPMETTYTWTAINDHQTKMTLRNCGAPSGFSKFFAPLMATMVRKANKKDLKYLKRILEDNG